ncbi:hypothetical protein F4808DRAFT_471321 [Astrocystis sublimbata]|nr:hypothetical protein F4808DRAFT_471321 [Astrocystis sublimbata]
MSSNEFQKMLESMNRQSLVRGTETQESGPLLPHQRTNPIKTDVLSQEYTAQTPKSTQNALAKDAMIRTDVSPPSTHVSMSSDVLRRKEPLPKQNRGLAASRWNQPTHQAPPVGGIGGPSATPPYSIPKRLQGKGETGASTPPTKKPSNWALAETPVPLAKNEINAHGSQLNSSGNMRDSGWGEVDTTPKSEWNKGTEARNYTWGSTGQALLEATPASFSGNAEGFQQPRGSRQSTEQAVGKLEATQISHDPRLDWPSELKIQDQVKEDMAKQEMLDQDVSSLDQEAPSDEEDCAIPQDMSDYISTWIPTAHRVTAKFLDENIAHHEQSDVDTAKGVLLSPIQHPRTTPQELMSRNQAEMTAAIFMNQFAAEKARKRKAQRKLYEQSELAAAAAEFEPAVPMESNPFEVLTPCFLRPATESDMMSIAAIYNSEIADGYKVMDTTPITPGDFELVYNRCMDDTMPFVVAVEGQSGAINAATQNIIGFSLVTAVSWGISGSFDTLARRGGKLLVIVKPEYRRKKVGTALMDIIMTNCTGWYLPKGGYDFVNWTPHSWMSKDFGSNIRKWWYLDMEVNILSIDNEEKTRKGEEFLWIWNFLESRFDLLLKHYDERCLYELREGNWLDKLTFRCVCRFPRD